MKQANPAKRTLIKPVTPSVTPKNRIESPLQQSSTSQEDYCQKVQQKAYELFIARGYAHGYDVEDWIRAEQIVKGS
jgi:hypothetical protein